MEGLKSIKRDLAKILKVYLIGSIEKCGDERSVGAKWREELTKKLYKLVDINGERIYVFDPIFLEKIKTGKSVKENMVYFDGLKRSGNWDIFVREQGKIWYGILYEDEKGFPYHIMGDKDYVSHSTFLICYLAEGDRPVGTVREMTWACDMTKPIFLVTNINKTELSSSLLGIILDSGGEIFSNFNQLIDFLKKKYHLKEIEEVKI